MVFYSFKCCMGDRLQFLNGACMLCVCWMVWMVVCVGGVVLLVIVFAVCSFEDVVSLLFMLFLSGMRSLLLLAALFSHI